MVIVDTSVFVEYLRGNGGDDLSGLILRNQVLLSPVVRLELLAGVRKNQLSIVERLLNALKPVALFADPAQCEVLLKKAKGSGLFGGIPDLLIIADALRYKALLFTYDLKMEKLAKRLGARIFCLC